MSNVVPLLRPRPAPDAAARSAIRDGVERALDRGHGVQHHLHRALGLRARPAQPMSNVVPLLRPRPAPDAAARATAMVVSDLVTIAGTVCSLRHP
jgi:hypothetical protein